MDYDYEGGEDFGGRILWRRVGVFVLAAFLFIFLGRCTAGGGGVDEVEFDDVVESNSEAQTALAERDSTIAGLQQRLVDAQASGPATPGTTPGSEDEGVAGGGSETTGPIPDGTTPGTYVVQEGDTLSTIAEAVYNDPLAFGPIAEANNIGGGNILQVGQTLTIPANPDSGQ